MLLLMTRNYIEKHILLYYIVTSYVEKKKISYTFIVRSNIIVILATWSYIKNSFIHSYNLKLY